MASTTTARRRARHLIERVHPERPLGGGVVAARGAASPAGRNPARLRLELTADRPHGNLNIEPGDSTLDGQMIASIERRRADATNVSWSHRRLAQQVPVRLRVGPRDRDGRLGRGGRNPNYRGISATFWRSLAMVGDASTAMCLGTPFCGKGEPSQTLRVGHAAPALQVRERGGLRGRGNDPDRAEFDLAPTTPIRAAVPTAA